MTTRVFVVDDHELVRRGLIELIDTEMDLSAVGQAGDVQEALVALTTVVTDVAVL